MGAFEWTAMILLFVLAYDGMKTWGNVARARATAEIEIAKLRALPPGETKAGGS